jgi:ketol-acid reductoisomerase
MSETSTTVYHDADADLSVLDDRTIAIVGYGNQGRAQALNLRDSGVTDVVVGNRADDSRERAREDGFEAFGIGEAVSRADVVFLLIPDEVAPTVYEETIEPNLSSGNLVNFASGFNVTYGYIEPADDLDVILLAPRMIGTMVRQLYERGRGAPSLLAVHRDATGEALDVALGLAKGIGSTRSGVVESTFEVETTTDLMSEQALFPLFVHAIMAKYRAEVEAGVPPEVALLESYLSREMGYIFEQAAKRGMIEQLLLHSRTSQYGQLTGLESFDPDPMEEFVRERLEGIQSGEFAEEWREEQRKGTPHLEELFEKYRESEMIQREQTIIETLGLDESVAED